MAITLRLNKEEDMMIDHIKDKLNENTKSKAIKQAIKKTYLMLK